MILTLSKEQRGVSKVIKPFQLSHFGQRALKMNRTKAAALSLLVGVLLGKVAEAAVLGASKRSFPADDDGQSRRRNATGVHVPSYMLALYRTLSALESRGTNRSASTVTSFTDLGKDHPSTDSRQRYIFDLSSLSRADEVVEAELRIFWKPPGDLSVLLSEDGSLYRILLHSCSTKGSSGKQDLFGSRTIDILDTERPQWDVFDVSPSVKALHSAHRNSHNGNLLCFEVSVLSDSTNEAVLPWILGFRRELQQPQERALLVTFSRGHRKESLFREIREKMKAAESGSLLNLPFDPVVEGRRPRRRRRRRMVLAGRSGGGAGGVGGGKGGGRRRTRCSRKPLHVNFKQLGWDDWIIAPLDYEAYHCEGVCDFPLRSHLEPTNHAIIQTLMNSMDPESTPPSCCVPSKLSPISILYIDSGNNVVYKQYEDMVVESCGCR
ncbi:growth/differentiation factor 6-A [Denticeps clupeoides]|uniref:TGF-beta family profile domain-containing protein n=1 Tax=Denticeps clupeoides TaxID=299321 RepID=A0AAY4AYM2_9TELE|nr:growth/differentiation factor 6-A-like [Denticeps clupeoides]